MKPNAHDFDRSIARPSARPFLKGMAGGRRPRLRCLSGSVAVEPVNSRVMMILGLDPEAAALAAAGKMVPSLRAKAGAAVWRRENSATTSKADGRRSP